VADAARNLEGLRLLQQPEREHAGVRHVCFDGSGRELLRSAAVPELEFDVHESSLSAARIRRPSKFRRPRFHVKALPNWRYFVVPGSSHTTLYNLPVTSGGTAVSTWLTQMTTDDPAWSDVAPY
jgi:hypothetical protein